jgi:divalent metal cation (Fe/Co/Zn/Cd) transporter
VQPDPTTEHLRARGIRLEWATNGWNLMEVVVTVSLGVAARSLALIAFGLDSLIEIFASTVVIWNLQDGRADPGDRRIHRALRLIAVAYWVLSGSLTVASVRSLLLGSVPGESPWGIAYLAVTAGVMFGLARAKQVTARALRSETLAAEAGITYLDGFLALSILASLALNQLVAWWWADAVAALLIAAWAAVEGASSWREGRPHVDARS